MYNPRDRQTGGDWMVFQRQPNRGLANCRYVAHQSDRQGQNAPKGYIARQEMTPESTG